MMKYKHVEDIIDSKPFPELNERELAEIGAHCAACAGCAAAFDAARVASVLMAAAADEGPSPSPYFNRTVMEQWRRRTAVRSSVEFLGRWWAAYNPMVASLVAVVLFLTGLAAFAPSREASPVVTNHSNLYPAEAVLIDHRPSRELNEEQVFQVIYTTRYEGRK
jgi:hypothetical protein